MGKSFNLLSRSDIRDILNPYKAFQYPPGYEVDEDDFVALKKREEHFKKWAEEDKAYREQIMLYRISWLALLLSLIAFGLQTFMFICQLKGS